MNLPDPERLTRKPNVHGIMAHKGIRNTLLVARSGLVNCTLKATTKNISSLEKLLLGGLGRQSCNGNYTKCWLVQTKFTT